MFYQSTRTLMKPYESWQKSEKSNFAYLKVLTHRIHADGIMIQFYHRIQPFNVRKYTLHSTCSSTSATRRGKGWRTCQYWRRFRRRFDLAVGKRTWWWWCGGFSMGMLCKVKLITLKSHDLSVTKGNVFQFTWGWLRLYISHSCGLVTRSTMSHQVVFVGLWFGNLFAPSIDRN